MKNRNKFWKLTFKYLYIFKLNIFPKFIKHIFYFEPAKIKMKNKLLKIIKSNKYDLIFLSKTEELDYKTIDEMNKYAKTYYYIMDPIKTVKNIEAIEYAKRATFSSATFSDVVSLFKKHKANTKQIVQGIEPEQFKLTKETQKKKYDVVFAGTIDKKRKNYIQYLQNNGIKITLFGKGTINGPIYNEELMKVYNQSKIVLNFSRNDKGFSVRVFEVMGSNTLLLTEYCEDLEVFFQKGKETDWFKSKKECLDLINYYLKYETKREKISKNAKEKVFKEFTWEKQINKILEFTNMN